MAYPQTPLGMRLEVAPRADFTADPATYTWTDITRDLQLSVPITHTRGAGDEQSESNSETVFALRNLTGRYTTDNALSDLWPDFDENVPFKFSTNTGDGTGWHQEWIQYLAVAVDDWPARTPHLCNTHITAAGLFRRIGQWDPLRSPLFRTMAGVAPDDYVPYIYHSGEDQDTATQVASGLAGGLPMSVTGSPSFAADDGLPGSLPLPTLPEGGQFTATIPSYVNTNQWVHQFVIQIPAAPSGNRTLMTYATPGGTVTSWAVTLEPGSPDALFVRAYNSAGSELFNLATGVDSGDLGGESDFYGHHFMISVATYQNAGNVWAWLKGKRADGLNLESATNLVAGTHAGLSGPMVFTSPVDGSTFGHSAIYIDPGFSIIFGGSQADINAAAMDGYAGEMAHERLERLCREHQIPFSSSATSTKAMGPQLIDTLIVNFRDCERADHGMLDDSQGYVGYISLPEMYNQTPALVIDGAVRGQLGTPFIPTTDDQRRKNRVTATRTGGSSYTHEVADDINGVPGLRPGVGVFAGDVEVNIESDDDLPYHASFVTSQGTVPGKRYPSLTIDFLRAPNLLAGYRNLRLCGRAQVTNPPKQHSRITADVLLPGWTTVINGRRGPWTLTANCSRYDPYNAGVLGDASTSSAWLQCDTTTVLAAELVQGATLLSVTATPLFTTTADLVTHPLSLLVGGEVMAVSAISGGANPQTFTVARSLNKRHAAGTPVQVHRPLLLVL